MGFLDRLRSKREPRDGGAPGRAAPRDGRDEPPGAATARNAEIDRLFAYHERTKHSHASVHGSYRQLDWANQPNPFRRHAGAPRVALPAPAGLPPDALPLRPLGETLRALAAPDGRGWPARGLPLLSSLLHHSLAISAWKQVAGTDVRWSLRVNPSSGNLHPTECWLALGGFEDVPDGLWHYDVAGHALEQRRAGPGLAALGALLGRPPAPPGSPQGGRHDGGPAGRGVLVVLTSIFWREAWKYLDRAYRYCNHDAGHAAVSLATAARALGFRAEVLGHFPDGAVRELLGLAGGDEHPLLALDLGGDRVPRPPAAGCATAGPDFALAHRAAVALAAPAGTPNALSPEEGLFPLIEGLHASTLVEHGGCPRADRLDESLPRGDEPPDAVEIPLPPVPPAGEPTAHVVRRRRSAVDYDPTGRCTLADLSGLLAEAACVPPADFLDTLEGGPPNRLVTAFVHAHRVEGLPPGCYRYLPERRALRLVRAGDLRAFAAVLSLGQELAGHAVCAFSLVADLERGARSFGNRAYRHAHHEAGMLGQGIYLAATARGLDATGIGAFYDDDVQRFLGLSGRATQVIYHHSFGRAAPDERLVEADIERDARDGDGADAGS